MQLSHVVYEPRTGGSRYAFAKSSWKIAGLSTIDYLGDDPLGQTLKVPVFNKIIDYVFAQTQSDFVLYTNRDIALVKNVREAIAPFLIPGTAHYVPNRQAFLFGEFFKTPEAISSLPSPKWGADTFLISRGWWKDKAKFLPSFLIGYPCWDEILIDLIGKTNLLPSIAYHEEHDSYWKSSAASLDPGLLYNITQASFNSLAIVIPFAAKSLDSLRLRNLVFNLKTIRKRWNGPIFIEAEVPFPEALVELLEPYNVSLRLSEPTLERINKSKLVNRAVSRALSFYPFSYILQLDADLYAPEIGSQIWDWVRSPLLSASWIYSQFIFLPRLISASIVRGSKISFDTNNFYNPQGFGPGGWLVSSEVWTRTGGMPEEFVGWGLEDTTFGDRVKSLDVPIARSKMLAYHLYHENDRRINRQSFQQTGKFTDGTYAECKFLASDKVLILDMTGTNALGAILSYHPNVACSSYNTHVESADTVRINTVRSSREYFKSLMLQGSGMDEESLVLALTLFEPLSESDIRYAIARDFTAIVIKPEGGIKTEFIATVESVRHATTFLEFSLSDLMDQDSLQKSLLSITETLRLSPLPCNFALE